MSRRRRWLGVALLVAGVAAAGWLLVVVYRAPNRTDLAAYWQLVVAVVAVFATVVPLWRRAPDRAAGTSGDRLARAQDRLGEAVRRQWTDAATQQKLLRPEAMAVHWSLVAPLTSRPAAGRSTAFPAVPGYPPVEPACLPQGGDVQDLYRVFGGLRCGRLLIAGAPGSGKSAAAVLLVVDTLHDRAELPEAERAGVPVPVLFPLAGWDPGAQSLRDWVAARLQRTYPALFPGRRGGRTARQLFDEGRIAVVLDGLDEMPALVRAAALTSFNDTLSTRLVVTTRQDEGDGVLGDQLLYDAVVVALDPVSAGRAATYLADTRPVSRSPEWAQLVGQVRDAPADPLARVLDNPLTITLVRDGLPERKDVAEFLDRCATPGVEKGALADHLLDQLVTTAYRARPGGRAPRYDAATARRTLQWVAARMDRDGASDLAWWRLPTWAPRLPPALLVGAVTGLVMFGFDVTGVVHPVSGLGGFGALGAAGAALGAWCAAGTESTPPVRWTDALDRPGLAFAYGLAGGVLAVGGIYTYYGSLVAVATAVLSVVGGGAWAAGSLWHRRGGAVSPTGVTVLGFGLGGLGLLRFGGMFGSDGLMAIYLVISLVGVGLALRIGLSPATGPAPGAALAPLASWRRRRFAALAGWGTLAVPCGLVVTFGGVFLSRIVLDLGFLAFGLAVLCGAALGLVFPESWLSSVACVQLAVRHRLPLRLGHFLDDARARGVLRVVGPVYQFRHVDLQRRLARSLPARPPLFRPEVEDAALAWVAARCPRPDEGTCRVAWWRIPEWAPPSPRVLVIGVAGGLLTWLGLGVLDPSLWLSVAGGLIGCAAGLSATVGAGLADGRPAGADAPPADPLSAVRRPGLLGAALGLGFAVDLANVIPPEVTLALSAGLISGAALWLLLGVVVTLGRGDAALRRWRGITTDRPLSSGIVLGATVGYLAATATSFLAASPTSLDRVLQVDAVVHLAVSATVLVVGLRIGFGAAPTPGSGAPPDPFASWRRRRRAQLLAWLLGGALGGGFVVRSGIRAAQLTLRFDSIGTAVVLLVGAALALAAAWGLLLGLLFPATWRTSLACVQLRLQHPVPVRLVRLLEDARSGGRVQAVGPWFLVPRVPEPDAPETAPARS